MATSTINYSKGVNDIRILYPGDDLNNLTKRNASGMYYITTAVHAPDNYCMLINMCAQDDRFTQQFVVAQNSRIYARAFVGNPQEWSAWKSVSLS